jgi:hypothetical protein
MRFEELASKAGEVAASVGRQAQRTAFSQVLAAQRRRSLVALSTATAVIVLAILGAVLIWPAPGSQSPAAAPAPTTTLSTSTTVVEDTVPAALAGVPESCPVTVPGDDAFAPPSEAPEGPPPLYESVWYGTPELWTMINPQGETSGKRWLGGEKTFWWSESFSVMGELEPDITVTAEHLDGSAPKVEAGGPGTNGFNPGLGNFMLVGLELPQPGCWELTARYKNATLSYVVWVD